MIQLIAIFAALIVGYGFKSFPLKEHSLNFILYFIVVLILFVMGYELGSQVTNLKAEIIQIGKIVMVFSVCLFVANFIAGMIVLRRLNKELRKERHVSKSANYWDFAKASGKYVSIVIVGIVAGQVIHYPLTALSELISGLLFVLLFIIGHQMRVSGVALRQVIINKSGLLLALVIIISSLAAGSMAALLSGLPLRSGLMLSSGFGWYTLASILNGNLLGQQYGTIAFFIDFIRELVAIILIPSLGQIFPATFVAYSGGTAMDFTLPIIKQNLHERCTLLAISSGMLLSLAVPILIPLLAKL